MTSRLRYYGTSMLSDKNRAFLAAACLAYRKTHDLAQSEAATLAGVSRPEWCQVEHKRGGYLFHVGSAAARIINLVLRVSPPCAKDYELWPSIAGPLNQGDSHDQKEEARSGDAD